MRIAVIGTGIAGNVAAYKLAREHDITVFESAGYVGGHTNTISVEENERTVPVDTGFIVFNDRTYPNFIALLDELGQDSQPSEMSFSVHAEETGFEYKGQTLNTLFAERRNFFRPRFYRMVRDILRFNEQAPNFPDHASENTTLGEYLDENAYSREFRDLYLIPMAAAIWSAEPVAVPDMPIGFLVRFFANHGLLQLKDRPIWRVIEGGSREYVEKLVRGHRDRIRLNAPVEALRRHDDGVDVKTASGGWETFDCVFVGCHSDQALDMLTDPTDAEREVLGAIPYQRNEAILHTDETLMPRRRRAWAAWNYRLPENPRRQVAVTYNMNILQSIDSATQYCVTLNDDRHIDPARIIRRVQYEHPIINAESVAAQARQAEINADRTFYCGAYWRNGFHEDGVASAIAALAHFEKRLDHGQLHLRRAS